MIDDFRGSRSFTRRRRVLTWLMLGLGLFGAAVVLASVRRHYSDAEIVSRAELIVVGKMKEGSMVLVHGSNANDWDQRMDLLVTNVLKGQTTGTYLRIRIDGCLLVVVGGYGSNWMGGITDLRPQGVTNFPKDMVQIKCVGYSSFEDSDLCEGDMRTNHIWLLRSEDHPGAGKLDRLSVFEPEDIQPIERKEELMKVLKSLPAKPR